MGFGTHLVHYDVAPDDPNQPNVTPIYQTATFEQDHVDVGGRFEYSRSGNPTRKVLEDHIAALESGTHGFAFASGMAAITCVCRLLSAGDEILADWDLYGGAARLFGRVLDRAGVRLNISDALDLDRFRAAITPATKLVYIESPTNPLLRVLDLRAVAQLAHERGLLVAVDSSAMTPYLQRPLELGVDIVIHSATKYLSGHSDVTAGIVVVKDAELAKRIYFLQNAEGNALAPFECFLLLRGLKTLKLRMDAQQKNAIAVAEYLRTQPAVASVGYPGFGALVTARLGSFERAKQFAEALKLFKIAVSFGSVTSGISLPATMSHASVPPEQMKTREIPRDLLRISVGIEDIDDLLADLAEQLALLG
ncbi:cystathionine beta-lyase [Bryocella elongata]|uniref:cysteine-S-conjugate beta-lyase n=2 Tax=Bryocella elongata TaxID=863522 RepID=A0A1H5TET5_9BACT|nr:cystathionine beta-lyase [Bryocella elongata]